MVDSSGTGTVADEEMQKLVRKHFELTPAGIIKSLDCGGPSTEDGGVRPLRPAPIRTSPGSEPTRRMP